MKKQSLILALLLVFSVSVNTFAGDTQSNNITNSSPTPSIVETIVTVLTQIVNLVP